MLPMASGDIETDVLEDNAERAAALLRSLANRWRLLILCQLVESEKSVSELERVLEISQSALSQHLMVLRRFGLVSTRRSAQMIYYSLNGSEATAILETLHELYCADDGDD